MCANSLVRYISRWVLCGLGPTTSGGGSLHVGEGRVLCHVAVPGVDGSTNDVPELPYRGAREPVDGRWRGRGGGLVHGRGCIPQSLQAATVTVTVEHAPLSLRTRPRSWSGESLQGLQNGLGLDGHEETRRGCVTNSMVHAQHVKGKVIAATHHGTSLTPGGVTTETCTCQWPTATHDKGDTRARSMQASY
jgi:hypothetical protein